MQNIHATEKTNTSGSFLILRPADETGDTSAPVILGGDDSGSHTETSGLIATESMFVAVFSVTELLNHCHLFSITLRDLIMSVDRTVIDLDRNFIRF